MEEQKLTSKNDPRLFFRKELFFVCIKFFIILVFAGGALYVFSLMIKKELVTLATYRGEYQHLLQEVDVIAKINEKKGEASFLYGDLKNVFPPTLQIPLSIIPRIRELLSQSGISGVVNLQKNDIPEDGKRAFVVNVTGTGKFSSINAFVASLEKEKTVFNINTFSLTQKEKSQLYDVVFQIKLYTKEL